MYMESSPLPASSQTLQIHLYVSLAVRYENTYSRSKVSLFVRQTVKNVEDLQHDEK